MAKSEQSPELFKSYSEDDQNEILRPQEEELGELKMERGEIALEKAELDRKQNRRANSMGGDPNANTAQIIASNVHSNSLGGSSDLIDALNAAVYMVNIPFQKHNESKLEEIDAKIKPKQEAYDRLANVKNDPVDPDKLNQELDALYDSQKKTYEDYLDTQERIGRKKNQIEMTKGILFARHGKMEDELKQLEDQASELLSDFVSNDDQVRKASGLSSEQTERFDEMVDKMAAAVRKANPALETPEPVAPPEPPETPTPPMPIVQTFVNAGMKITCPFANGAQVPFGVTPEHRVLLENLPKANIMDFKPLVNIPSFGMCSTLTNPAVAAATEAKLGVFTPAPCVPAIMGPWKPGKLNVLLDGAPALLNTDTCQCMWGGVISFVPDAPGSSNNSKLGDALETLGGELAQEAGEKAIEVGGKKIAAKGQKLMTGELDNIPRYLRVMGDNGIVRRVLNPELAKRYAQGLKLLKAGGNIAKVAPLLTPVTLGVGFAFEDTSDYAKSSADAAAKHDGQEPKSASEWGQVIGDYGAGYWKDMGVPDGVADFGNYVVRDTADTIDALNTVGSEAGAALAEEHPAPSWLLDFYDKIAY